MRAAALRLARVPLMVAAVWAAMAVLVPLAMSQYAPYAVRGGIRCMRVGPPVRLEVPFPADMCMGLHELYRLTFTELMVESTLRSLALLAGAAVLALVVGSLLGFAAALARRRAWTGAGIVALTSALSAVPSFFVAYFLQIAVVLAVGAFPPGTRLLPVFGFGYDGHLVLPMLSISLAAIAFTAQLTAARAGDVLDSDFVTAAHAKGLGERWILTVHVLPHVRPVLLEALGSGMRVAVASLPIVEFLFNWRGIGQLALEAVGVHDAPALIFSAVVLSALFTTLSAVSDIARPKPLYGRA